MQVTVRDPDRKRLVKLGRFTIKSVSTRRPAIIVADR
jgi:hypothetical protein